MAHILVSGATSGFGLEIAKAFLQKNHVVFGTGRRKENLQELQLAYPKHFIPLCFDLQNKLETKRAIETIFSMTDRIDALINNAGLALGLNKAYECELDDWEIMIDTNIKGLLYLTRLILPSMIEYDQGTIINLGSIAGTYAYPGGNVYGASKAFVKQFSLNLRADLAGTNIRVSNVEPGSAWCALKAIKSKPNPSMKTPFTSSHKILLTLCYGFTNNPRMSISTA